MKISSPNDFGIALRPRRIGLANFRYVLSFALASLLLSAGCGTETVPVAGQPLDAIDVAVAGGDISGATDTSGATDPDTQAQDIVPDTLVIDLGGGDGKHSGYHRLGICRHAP